MFLDTVVNDEQSYCVLNGCVSNNKEEATNTTASTGTTKENSLMQLLLAVTTIDN